MYFIKSAILKISNHYTSVCTPNLTGLMPKKELVAATCICGANLGEYSLLMFFATFTVKCTIFTNKTTIELSSYQSARQI